MCNLISSSGGNCDVLRTKDNTTTETDSKVIAGSEERSQASDNWRWSEAKDALEVRCRLVIGRDKRGTLPLAVQEWRGAGRGVFKKLGA
ncbi:hypothetical protein J6590_052089 [Homalodisca vitripennis]|nr:hypothetical protein J6590_052089 [Homalodisca vitripennis]